MHVSYSDGMMACSNYMEQSQDSIIERQTSPALAASSHLISSHLIPFQKRPCGPEASNCDHVSLHSGRLHRACRYGVLARAVPPSTSLPLDSQGSTEIAPPLLLRPLFSIASLKRDQTGLMSLRNFFIVTTFTCLCGRQPLRGLPSNHVYNQACPFGHR